jgi:hypothetical protein
MLRLQFVTISSYLPRRSGAAVAFSEDFVDRIWDAFCTLFPETLSRPHFDKQQVAEHFHVRRTGAVASTELAPAFIFPKLSVARR